MQKFVDLVSKRDELVGKHFGEVSNCSEEEWYLSTIAPLDDEIVEEARKIMNIQFKDVTEVYQNQELIQMYEKHVQEQANNEAL